MALEMKYFVLKPKSKKASDRFARASRTAMDAFADSIETHDSNIARDLRQWAERERKLSNNLFVKEGP